MRKNQRISEPGILVFPGQPALFKSVEDAERYAEHLIEKRDVKYVTIIGNTRDESDKRSVMESALVVVNRGVVVMTTQDAIKEGFLDDEPDPEEEW